MNIDETYLFLKDNSFYMHNKKEGLNNFSIDLSNVLSSSQEQLVKIWGQGNVESFIDENF